MEQLSPAVTYFHGCLVTWTHDKNGGKLLLVDPTCTPQGSEKLTSRPWTTGLQQQIFPHRQPTQELHPDTAMKESHSFNHERVFGFVIDEHDHDMNRLKKACIILGIPYENREDYATLIQEYGCQNPDIEGDTACTFDAFLQRVEADANTMRERLQQDAASVASVPDPARVEEAEPEQEETVVEETVVEETEPTEETVVEERNPSRRRRWWRRRWWRRRNPSRRRQNPIKRRRWRRWSLIKRLIHR